MTAITITVAYGDGFAPAVMEAALTVLREAGANITIETIEIGSRIYSMESKTGILPSAWKVLEKNHVLLKAPVIVPEGCKETGEVIREYFGLDNTNINEHFAMFEPIFPDECWEKKSTTIDPSPMIHAAIMMLNHIGQQETATLIHDALNLAIKDSCHIKDRKRLSRMTEAVIERLGRN
jgi:isocitrate/isopropylmalate dehydrogenase